MFLTLWINIKYFILMFNISSEHLQGHLVQLLCRVTFSPHRVSHRRSISQGKYYCLKIPHFQLQVLSIWNSHRCPGWAYDQLAQQLAQYGTTAACSIPFCGPGQGGSWRVHELPEPPTIFCGEGKQTNKWKKRCFFHQAFLMNRQSQQHGVRSNL